MLHARLTRVGNAVISSSSRDRPMADATDPWLTWRHRRRMRYFVGRMLNREMAQAWEQWRQSSAMNLKLQKFGRKMLGRSLVKALGTWVDAKDEFLRIKVRLTSPRIRAQITWKAT